jgi:hypothetical protein
MDGINPTLAFIALLFGLSGNARDVTHDLPARAEIDGGSGCSALMVAGDLAQPPSQEQWTKEFWTTAAGGSTLPDLFFPSWVDSALVAIKGSQPPRDLPQVARSDGSDPIMRRTVSAGTNVRAAIPGLDPCRPKR